MSLLKGTIILLIVILNTLLWVPILVLFSVVKFIIPVVTIRKYLSQFLVWIANNWIWLNTKIHLLLHGNKIDLKGMSQLTMDDWYLVISNHRAAADIPILQNVFYKKIPFLKFFLKQQLMWVPVLGMAWWALDFPFMKRYSKSYIKKNPHKKGQDFETTKKACEKFKTIPISIMNFSEGTRFTQAKRDKQQSPFKHLLKPKAGGIGYVLTLMGEEITKILDVTIDYPDHHSPSFWDLMTGRLDKIIVTAKLIDIPEQVQGSYIESSDQRKKVQRWVNELWQAKDEQLNLIRENE